jgi:outer membrane protein assembly factor BamB
VKRSAEVLAVSMALAVSGSALGCSSSDGESAPGHEHPDAEAPAAPAEDVLGAKGASASLTTIFAPARKNLFSATALALNPDSPSELWALLRQVPSGLPCTENDPGGCSALEGQVAIIEDPHSKAPAVTVKKDPNAWHFMRRPTSIAFGSVGDGDTFATCGEARTDNYEDETIDYAGPVLWSSNLSIFAIQPPGKNGSHIDMLHNSPFCMGIAHETKNVYWAFNGKLGSLDRYDFKAPHEVGGEDHSDGEMLRYAEGEVKRSPEIPSHLAFDAEDGMLYVADTGNGRVARLDTKSGSRGLDCPTNDPIDLHAAMVGTTLDEFVPAGDLDAPSGITLYRGVIFVTDNSTSEIHAYDRDGKELRSLDTGLPAGSLSGIAVSEEGVVYLADLATGSVLRVDVP